MYNFYQLPLWYSYTTSWLLGKLEHMLYLSLTSFCSLSMSLSYSSFLLFNCSSNFRHLHSGRGQHRTTVCASWGMPHKPPQESWYSEPTLGHLGMFCKYTVLDSEGTCRHNEWCTWSSSIPRQLLSASQALRVTLHQLVEVPSTSCEDICSRTIYMYMNSSRAYTDWASRRSRQSWLKYWYAFRHAN